MDNNNLPIASTNTTSSNNNNGKSPMMTYPSLPIRHISTNTTANSISVTSNNNNTNNNGNVSATSGVPQYQQYFTLLQSMASSNSSGSTSSSLSNLPSTSSIMAMHGIPSTSTMRKTSFSAILAGNVPKSVNLQTLSNQIATPQSTIQKPKSNSPPSTSTAANSSNTGLISPAMGVVSTQSAQNSSELVASGTVPSNLLESSSVNNTNNGGLQNIIQKQNNALSDPSNNNPNQHQQIENMRPVPISNMDSTIESPNVSTPKQRKPRKKKGEETPTLESSPATVSSPQEGNDDDSNEKSKGRSKTCKRWTEEQNRLLKDSVIKYGPRNWKKIAAEICGGIFTADQCNQHWHRVLHPRIIKGEWTPEEDNLLLEKVEEFGESSWTKVAESLAGRTDIQCRHRYFQKKKENDTGRRKSITSISSPYMGGSLSPSPSLGQTATAYDLSPMLGSSGSMTESTHSILNNALMSGANFPSPSLGISPSSILSGASSNTSNFVHQHRVPLFSAPSNVSLQERLKGDSVVLGSTTPTMNSPFISNIPDSQIPPFPSESRRKQTQYFYVEKNGLDESDFTPPLATVISSPTLTTPVSLDALEKKESIGATTNSNSNINENLLLCDEEDLSTPNIEKDLDSIKKKSISTKNSNMMITDDDDDMDEDEEEAQLTIDDMDNEKLSPLIKPVANNTAQVVSQQLSTPELIKKEIPESPQLNSPAIVGASPSMNEKPKKRSSALNRMRANINVWVPFSESEETMLRKEISKQLKQFPQTSSLPVPQLSSDPNAPKPIQVISYANEDFLDKIDFVTILKENSSSFHPLRTPVSLKVHSQALRQELGDSALIDENFKGNTPRSLYEKVNTHSWLASSKNSRTSTSSSEPSKPGRRRKNAEISTADGLTSISSGKPPIPGRKRKNAPISNSPAMAIPSNNSESASGTSNTQLEPSQKKTKLENESATVADSTFLVLLLGKGAPKETKQIQPSKMLLPLETTLSELVSKIREELSIDYDPKLICDFKLVSNYGQTLRNLMEENDIEINELLIQYK